MRLPKNSKMIMFIGLLLFLILEIIIGIAISKYTDTGFLGFLYTVIGLLFISLVVWLKITFWKLLMSKIFRKTLVDEYESRLKEFSYPKPAEDDWHIDRYLSSVQSNKKLKTKVRILAAMDIQSSLAGSVFDTMMLDSIRNEALLNYKKYLDLKA